MAEKVTLAVNVPLDLMVRYCDIVGGEHGLEFRFKGRREPDGGDVVLYLAHDPCLDAMVRAKVLGTLPEYSLEARPDKPIEVQLVEKRLRFLAEMRDGSRKRWLVIAVRPEPDAMPAGSGASSSSPAPVAGKPVRCDAAYLDVMRAVATTIVPEFTRLYGHAPSDDAIVGMNTTIYIQHCRETR